MHRVEAASPSPRVVAWSIAGLTGLQDRRGARGLRRALVTASVSLLLARLCGADHLRRMARSLRRLGFDNTEHQCYNWLCWILVQKQLGVLGTFLRPVRAAEHKLWMDKCQVLVQKQLGVMLAFLRPVRTAKRKFWMDKCQDAFGAGPWSIRIKLRLS
jgi:hypothetical protein